MSESAKPITSTDLYLDEIVVILRRIELVLTDIEDTNAELVWRAQPWWYRWTASWRHAKALVNLTEQEGKQLRFPAADADPD
jgi:hypothetical protein